MHANFRKNNFRSRHRLRKYFLQRKFPDLWYASWLYFVLAADLACTWYYLQSVVMHSCGYSYSTTLLIATVLQASACKFATCRLVQGWANGSQRANCGFTGISCGCWLRSDNNLLARLVTGFRYFNCACDQSKNIS